ncbi:hypothetical protein TNCV_21401 [Trichonephila clavipes]|nr:hypothetical protein TNCV_21401 [Trichonephila clavipes]
MCPVVAAIHCCIDISMLPIKLSDTETESEGQIWINPFSSSCKGLGFGPKTPSGLPSNWSWLFHPFQIMILEINLNKHSLVISRIIIHQKEFITSSSCMAEFIDQGSDHDISLKSDFLHGSHADHCNHRDRDIRPNHNTTTSPNVSFNIVGLVVSGALFPADQQTP